MAERSVAVIGASAARSKFSNKSIRAHASKGWTVYPVNPKGEDIEGLKTYASVTDVPQPLERVSLYLPSALGVKVLPDIAAAKPREFIVNPGAESEELVTEARALGLEPKLLCSIVDIGCSPAQFPD